MKNISIVFISILFTCCISKSKNIEETGSISYLDSIIPYMEDFAKNTMIIFDWRFAEDESIIGVVGKFIDSTKIYALSILPEDTLISFHSFNDNSWQQIGTHKAISDAIFQIDFIDMDNDMKNEIIVRTPPNMNGNTWQDIFRYSIDYDSIELAGNFSTDFEIKKESKTVEETYEGSWYMTPTKALYQWHNNKLIAIKLIALPLVESDIRNDDRIFYYYENPSLDKDTLILKIRTPYKGKKYKDIWDNFFDASRK